MENCIVWVVCVYVVWIFNLPFNYPLQKVKCARRQQQLFKAWQFCNCFCNFCVVKERERWSDKSEVEREREAKYARVDTNTHTHIRHSMVWHVYKNVANANKCTQYIKTTYFMMLRHYDVMQTNKAKRFGAL